MQRSFRVVVSGVLIEASAVPRAESIAIRSRNYQCSYSTEKPISSTGTHAVLPIASPDHDEAAAGSEVAHRDGGARGLLPAGRVGIDPELGTVRETVPKVAPAEDPGGRRWAPVV